MHQIHPQPSQNLSTAIASTHLATRQYHPTDRRTSCFSDMSLSVWGLKRRHSSANANLYDSVNVEHIRNCKLLWTVFIASKRRYSDADRSSSLLFSTVAGSSFCRFWVWDYLTNRWRMCLTDMGTNATYFLYFRASTRTLSFLSDQVDRPTVMQLSQEEHVNKRVLLLNNV